MEPLNLVCLLYAMQGGEGGVSAVKQSQSVVIAPAGLNTHSSASHRHLYLNLRKTLLFLSASTGEGFIMPM